LCGFKSSPRRAKTMRAFVALDVSDPVVLDAVVAFQKELTTTGADVKTVERENIHFTVKFLGEISEAQVSEADGRLRGLRLSSLTAEIKGIGAFPSTGRPGVVWAGVPQDQELRIKAIADAAIAVLEGIGERDKRPFTAHATLARVRSNRGSGSLTKFLHTNANRSFGETRLTELKLKSSVLSPRGPKYTEMGAYALH